MKIKLIKPCEFGEVGTILDPDMPDIAHLLVRRGVAVYHEDPVVGEPDVLPPEGLEEKSMATKPPPNKMVKSGSITTKASK